MRLFLFTFIMLASTAGCAISTQREIEMGTDYSRQINAQLPIIKDPEVTRYINLLGDSIARVTDDRNLDWRFFIVDSPEVNAFAVPGGYVYVNRGLVERTQTMNQLAGVRMQPRSTPKFRRSPFCICLTLCRLTTWPISCPSTPAN